MENKEVLNDKIKPYNDQENKTRQLRTMFNKISKDYDFFNNLMSWGLAHLWRRTAMKWLRPYESTKLLDIATGTADMILLAEKVLKPEQMKGIDISEEMMNYGREKLRRASLDQKSELLVMDCAELNFADESFDTVTIAFGIRNVEQLSKSLHEIHRVLKPDGRFLIVEMNEPQKGLLAYLYTLYIKVYVQLTTRLLSSDKEAYSYLTKSMHYFPQGKALIEILTESKFNLLKYKSFTFGVCSAYLLKKVN